MKKFEPFLFGADRKLKCAIVREMSKKFLHKSKNENYFITLHYQHIGWVNVDSQGDMCILNSIEILFTIDYK